MRGVLLAVASLVAAGCSTPMEMTRDDLFGLKGDGSVADFAVDPETGLTHAGAIFRDAGLFGIQRAEGEWLVTAYGHRGGAFGTYAGAWFDPIDGGSRVTVVTRGKANIGIFSSIKLLDESTFLEEMEERVPRIR